jgi:hypothetical protein
MTKSELIKAIEDFRDNAQICVFCGCKRLTDLSDVTRNGTTAQLNTVDARALIDRRKKPLPKDHEKFGMFEADELYESGFINKKEQQILKEAAMILRVVAEGDK